VIHAIKLIEVSVVTKAVNPFCKNLGFPTLQRTLPFLSKDQDAAARFCPAALLN
jgi:hypothetical protein